MKNGVVAFSFRFEEERLLRDEGDRDFARRVRRLLERLKGLRDAFLERGATLRGGDVGVLERGAKREGSVSKAFRVGSAGILRESVARFVKFAFGEGIRAA